MTVFPGYCSGPMAAGPMAPPPRPEQGQVRTCVSHEGHIRCGTQLDVADGCGKHWHRRGVAPIILPQRNGAHSEHNVFPSDQVDVHEATASGSQRLGRHLVHLLAGCYNLTTDDG